MWIILFLKENKNDEHFNNFIIFNKNVHEILLHIIIYNIIQFIYSIQLVYFNLYITSLYN